MSLFSPEALAAFRIPGIVERWAAVQEHVHPCLVTLAEHVHTAASRCFPRQWPLYEISYKSRRYINHGHGKRAPIDDYHIAFDRPPRGAGILVSVSGAEQAILVGIQLWGMRKPQLQRITYEGQSVWQPLISRIEREGAARFAGAASRRLNRSKGETTTADTQTTIASSSSSWLDHYLTMRQANYLWAGFIYPWNNLPDDLAQRLVADILALFPLNESLMEQAEAHEPSTLQLLRERQSLYGAETMLPPIDTIIERIRARGFTFSETIIRSYHIALQTRPFVILPGISGVGKTRLTRLYADAVHGLFSSHQPNPYYLLVAVQPDWHNARDLLGYYNALTNVYHPTLFLRFLLQATADPQQLYFVCFDEMNLARPEYYLAPILSALETTDQSIDIGVPTETAQSVTGETISNPLRLPLNLRLIGTVNVDESAYTLSDKLLDRANVIELSDIDLPAFYAAYTEPIDEHVWRLLTHIHAIVSRAGQPFGYRVLSEILHYINRAEGIFSVNQALDLQLKQKILPKLRGDDNPRLRRALNDLLAVLGDPSHYGEADAKPTASEPVTTAPFPESAEKVRHMLERLVQDGFTDFYS